MTARESPRRQTCPLCNDAYDCTTGQEDGLHLIQPNNLLLNIIVCIEITDYHS